MKLNPLILLGATSLLVTAIPVSGYALTAQSSPPATSAVVSPTTIGQNQSVAIASGTFVAGEKPTTGTARIITENGHRYLELDAAFSTSNQGPDLHVLLDPTAKPSQSYSTLGSVINLGGLREYNGSQRYPIPDSINIGSFKSVVIWCRMANATFGYAPLQAATNAQR